MFDEAPDISIGVAPDGSFERMELRYDPGRRPMVLRPAVREEIAAGLVDTIDIARADGRDDIAAAVKQAKLVLVWEVGRVELDEDAWFALQLWQAWILGRSPGWLYAPGDGLFDAELQRCCPAL